MKPNPIKVMMLCTEGLSSRIMFHGINSYAEMACVVVENKVPIKRLIQRRFKKLGYIETSGQLAFLVMNKLLARFSQARIETLVRRYGLNSSPIPAQQIKQVNSINSAAVIQLIQEVQPDVIIVNGTRIIGKRVLGATDAPFINTHMGITPHYRGVHGGYWALAEGDAQNCGVTVHLVDEGIDTGDILYQALITVEKADHFNSYPIHQIAHAIPLMRQALDDVANQRLQSYRKNGRSRLWYHPTIWGYLKNRLLRGVK